MKKYLLFLLTFLSSCNVTDTLWKNNIMLLIIVFIILIIIGGLDFWIWLDCKIKNIKEKYRKNKT
jgi:Trk-type K+ transport system membrane component